MKSHPELYNSTTRKLFGLTASLDPHELYSAIDRPNGHDLPQRTKNHIKELANERGNIFSKIDYIDKRAGELLAVATRGVYAILRNEFEKHTDIDSDKRYRIATNPSTAETIALLALRSDTPMQGIISLQRNISPDTGKYTANIEKGYLEVIGKLKPENSGGCPFAGHEGIVKPDPMFIKAISALGTLAVDCYDTHDIKKDV